MMQATEIKSIGTREQRSEALQAALALHQGAIADPAVIVASAEKFVAFLAS